MMPWLADRPVRNNQATAYLCEHFVCLPPVTVPADPSMQLEWAGRTGRPSRRRSPSGCGPGSRASRYPGWR